MRKIIKRVVLLWGIIVFSYSMFSIDTMAQPLIDDNVTDNYKLMDHEGQEVEQTQMGKETLDDPEIQNEVEASNEQEKSKVMKLSDVPGEKVNIPEGIYQIILQTKPQFCLDVAGGSGQVGAKVQIYTQNATNAQKWKLQLNDDGWYTIININSKKVLSSASDEMSSSTSLCQTEDYQRADQRYQFYEMDVGIYCIVAKTGAVIDVSDFNFSNEADLKLYTYNGSVAQKWILKRDIFENFTEKEVLEGYYTLHMQANESVCADVKDFSDFSGANIQLWSDSKNLAQRFRITRKSNGWYEICNVSSEKVLDVQGGGSVNGTNIQQWDANGSAAQEFRFYENEDGAVIIKPNLGTDMVLDVNGGNLNPGGNVQIYSFNDSIAQKWILREATDPIKDLTETSVSDGWYSLHMFDKEEMCIDIDNYSNSSGANAQLWQDSQNMAQRFHIKRKENGWYEIYNISSGKALDVQGGQSRRGANIQQWDANGTAAQEFKFYEDMHGAIVIRVNLGRVHVWDITSHELNSGGNLQIDNYSGSGTQKFKLKSWDIPGEECRLESATYRIYPTNAVNFSMDVTDASKLNGANIQLCNANGSGAQEWKLIPVGEWYCLESGNSDKVLDVTGGKSNPETNLRQWSRNNGPGQLFKFYKKENNSYFIMAKTGTVIECKNGNFDNLNNVQMNSFSGTVAQLWSMEKILFPAKDELNIANGNYQINSALNNRIVLDVYAGSRAPGANIQLWNSNGTVAQEFYIHKEMDGWYSIQNSNSKMYLDVTGASGESKTNLQQYWGNGSDAQKFRFYEAGGGKFYIRSKLGTVVDVPDSNASDGVNVWMHSFNESTAQKWSVSKPTEHLMTLKANLYSSTTPYIVLMNRSTHKVAVFQGWQGNWNRIRYWDCSDGAPSTPTVEGVFKVGSRGHYFDSGASRCFWYTQFYGNYLFHSVLYNKNGTLQDGRLGMALSHGCVRLEIGNAKWIYDTIPSGTTVVVYH